MQSQKRLSGDPRHRRLGHVYGMRRQPRFYYPGAALHIVQRDTIARRCLPPRRTGDFIIRDATQFEWALGSASFCEHVEARTGRRAGRLPMGRPRTEGDPNFRRTVQSDRAVTELRERRQIAPQAAAEVENRERRRTDDALKQRSDVLTDVVVARAFPETLLSFPKTRRL